MRNVEAAIRKACETFDVEEIVCDPARWSRNIQALADEGLPMVEYPQSAERLIPATTTFYDAVMDSRLSWVDDELGKALETHIAGAEVKETEKGAMIKKPAFVEAAANIDCAVAAVMAHDRATRARELANTGIEWFNPYSMPIQASGTCPGP
jgi:phage terminase large subunit-like protein